MSTTHPLALALARLTLLASTAIVIPLLACSDDTRPADARVDGRRDLSASDLAASDLAASDHAGQREARPPDGHAADRAREAAVTPDYGVVKSCAAIGSKECFGSVECAADQRCKNLGTSSDPVVCCVPGARGPKAAGEACSGEDECASAVCIAKSGPSLCSKDCTSAADCPTGMKSCIAIAFSGSSLKWCFPEL